MPSFEIDKTTMISEASIKIIGVGGCGGNAVNSMIDHKIVGVGYITCNTDVQALESSLAETKIRLGQTTTKGYGAGFDPVAGRSAAEEDRDAITESLRGADMIFIAAGMGKGTGTGASPVVASIAKRLGILAIGIVTSPFNFEGEKTKKIAEEGISELRQYVDTLVIVNNQKIFDSAPKGTHVKEAYSMANDILYRAAKGISEIITKPGFVNVDFADVRNMLKGVGDAVIGSATANGEDKGRRASMEAISSPMIEKKSIRGAKGVLVNITGHVEIQDVESVMNHIHSEVGDDARVVHGVGEEESESGDIRVTIIATGFPSQEEQEILPRRLAIKQPPQLKSTQLMKDKANLTEPLHKIEKDKPSPNLELDKKTKEDSEKSSKKKPPTIESPIGLDQRKPKHEKQENVKNKIDKSDPDIPAYLRIIRESDP